MEVEAVFPLVSLTRGLQGVEVAQHLQPNLRTIRETRIREEIDT